MTRKLLPRKVDVFGKTVIVAEIPNLHNPLNLSEKVDGVFWSEKNQILIDANLKTEDKYIAFAHELGHAMFDRLFSSSGISSEMEELIVDNTAVLFSEVFNLTIKRKK